MHKDVPKYNIKDECNFKFLFSIHDRAEDMEMVLKIENAELKFRVSVEFECAENPVPSNYTCKSQEKPYSLTSLPPAALHSRFRQLF